MTETSLPNRVRSYSIDIAALALILIIRAMVGKVVHNFPAGHSLAGDWNTLFAESDSTNDRDRDDVEKSVILSFIRLSHN